MTIMGHGLKRIRDKAFESDKSEEILSFIGSICGLLALIGLVGCTILFTDHLPKASYCCDDGGNAYYAPSGLMLIVAVGLLPITMLIGLISGIFLGYWKLSIATAILVCAWVCLKGISEDLKTERLSRWKKEHQDAKDRISPLGD